MEPQDRRTFCGAGKLSINDADSSAGIDRRAFIGSSLALGLGALVGSGRAYGAEHVVETAQGKLRGRSAGGVSSYLGVAYGASTAGINRFRPPQPAPGWTGVRDAVSFGPQAPQLAFNRPDVLQNSPQPISEDCLYLNVFTTGIGASPKPVMVWLHGGGWRVGSGSIDGANLARMGDVVVVSINHRLGLFGHLLLDGGDPGFAHSANAGILDMVAALRWVRENIAAFGGDPGNVTIFGQSGGGSKVSALMAVPAAKGLFHKAIAQSCSGTLRVASRAEAEASAQLIARQLGLRSLTGAALQAIPMDTLLAAVQATTPNGNAFRPVLDGRTFTRHPFDPDAPPMSADIPFMAGNADTETTAELAHDPANFSLDLDTVQHRLGRYLQVGHDRVGAILAAYSRENPLATPSELLATITTDYQYKRNTERQALLQSQAGKAPVYYYVFDWRGPAMDGLLKSPHASDVPFVFGNASPTGRLAGANPDDVTALNRIMTATWSAFARTGNPDNPAIPHWPRYDGRNRQTMMLNVRSKTLSAPGAKARESLSDLPYYEYAMPINFDEA